MENVKIKMQNDRLKFNNNESRQPRPQAGEVSRNSSEARIGATLVSPRRGVIFQHWIPAFAGMTIAVIFAFSITLTAHAAFNPEINYQGKLANSANVTVADGFYSVRFNLYTSATGGVPIWTETWCNTSDCAGGGAGADNRIKLTNGLFSTMLGSTTPFTGVDFNQPLYLGVVIGGSEPTAVWDSEMTPRKILGAVPAAFYAATSSVALTALTASSSDTLSGLNSTQFVRTDAQNATSSVSTFLNILQSGAGKIAEFFGSAYQSVLSILSGGQVGIGTTTPMANLSVAGQAGQTTPILAVSSSTAAFATSTTFIIDANGKVGIGTTSPYAQLGISGLVSASYFNADQAGATSTFAGGFKLGSLNGLLTAVSGNVYASSTLSVAYGGTGLSTFPLYGNLLVGNANGGYSLFATSSLNLTIPLASTTGILTVANGGTGQSSFAQGWLGINDSGAFISSTSPTVAYITATSTTATSTFQNVSGNQVAGSYFIGTSASTSTFAGGFQTNLLNVTSATASSTFGNGLNLAKGCFSVLGVCIPSNATSTNYWYANGNNIYNNNSGNVGIGTTTPYASLSVAGASGVVANIFTATSTTATSTLAGGLTAAGASGLTVLQNGSAGIGTDQLSTSKFKVAVSSLTIIDGYDNSSRIATNSNMAVSGSKLLLSQAVCGSYQVHGSGSDSGTVYGTVLGADNKCWLDRNLGATRVATTFDDYGAGGGYLFQWGRASDGHQVVTSGTTAVLSTSGNANNGGLFITNGSTNYDWIDNADQNNTLWTGVSAVNNPCPSGFRLPTGGSGGEWQTLTTAEHITNSATAFSSSLKLPAAGYRSNSSAGLDSRGSYGSYWSSSVTGISGVNLYFSASAVYPPVNNSRAYGFSVRCVKD